MGNRVFGAVRWLLSVGQSGKERSPKCVFRAGGSLSSSHYYYIPHVEGGSVRSVAEDVSTGGSRVKLRPHPPSLPKAWKILESQIEPEIRTTSEVKQQVWMGLTALQKNTFSETTQCKLQGMKQKEKNGGRGGGEDH